MYLHLLGEGPPLRGFGFRFEGWGWPGARLLFFGSDAALRGAQKALRTGGIAFRVQGAKALLGRYATLTPFVRPIPNIVKLWPNLFVLQGPIGFPNSPF